MNIEEKIISLLAQKQKTLATVESCTGGLLASRLTGVSGASEVFKLGLIVYSNDAKTQLAGVKRNLLQTKGAVSEDVAVALAQGTRKQYGTDFAIGITGIAGPTGGTKKKPVGLVYIAVATNTETLCLKCQFGGTRSQVRNSAVSQALKLLLEFLK
jgi:nicotinamide-nucleotide amidase